MYGLAAAAIILALVCNGDCAPPVRVTIDCGSRELAPHGRSSHRLKSSDPHSRFEVESFCDLIHRAIPKAVKNGRFIVRQSESDQTGYSDTLASVTVPPPEGFIPKLKLQKLKVPKLKVPKINVPKLRAQSDRSLSAPRVGHRSSKYLTTLRSSTEDESSAERMDRFRKGVQKMLHVVKVLGQIDRYLSDRTRIVIDKLAKTFAD